MQGSSWNRGFDHSGNEVFSKLCIPPEIPFFVRLYGTRFQAISEILDVAHATTGESKRTGTYLCWHQKRGKTLIHQIIERVKLVAGEQEVA